MGVNESLDAQPDGHRHLDSFGLYSMGRELLPLLQISDLPFSVSEVAGMAERATWSALKLPCSLAFLLLSLRAADNGLCGMIHR